MPGRLVSIVTHVLLTGLTCELLRRAVSVERRGRNRRLNDSGVDGSRPVATSVGLAMSAMPQMPDGSLHAANPRDGP